MSRLYEIAVTTCTVPTWCNRLLSRISTFSGDGACLVVRDQCHRPVCPGLYLVGRPHERVNGEISIQLPARHVRTRHESGDGRNFVKLFHAVSVKVSVIVSRLFSTGSPRLERVYSDRCFSVIRIPV